MQEKKQDTKATEKPKEKKPSFLRRLFGSKKQKPHVEEGTISKPNLTSGQQEELNKELFQAVINNDIENVKTYLKLGGDKDYKLKEEQRSDRGIFDKNSTLLVIASSFGYTDIVEELIKNGADVNIPTKTRWTALMSAILKDHLDTCKLLVENGANVNLQDNNGDTALTGAVKWEYTDTVKYLLLVGANPFLKTKGKTAYNLAHNEEIKQIIKTFENLWERLGEETYPILIQNVNTAIKDCSPANIKEIFENL